MDGYTGRFEPSIVARGRGRPRNAEIAAIDSQLLEAALAEFLRCGYGAASMRGIARAARVSRTTLTARFASKADLFCALMTAQAADISTVSKPAFDEVTDLAHGLTEYLDRALAAGLHPQARALSRLIISTAEQFPEVAAPVHATTVAGIAEVADFIARCAEAEGTLCRNPEIPAKTIVLIARGWYQCELMGYAIAPAAEQRRNVEAIVAALLAGRSGW